MQDAASPAGLLGTAEDGVAVVTAQPNGGVGRERADDTLMEHRFVHPVVREICTLAPRTASSVTEPKSGASNQLVRPEATPPRKGR